MAPVTGESREGVVVSAPQRGGSRRLGLDARPEREPITTPPSAVTLAEASRFWLPLGWLSFDGSAGQIERLHRALVDRRSLHALNQGMPLARHRQSRRVTPCRRRSTR
jgi:hypothetical protein